MLDSDREMIDELVDLAHNGDLSSWEEGFIENIADLDFLSEPRQRTLWEIYEKHLG